MALGGDCATTGGCAALSTLAGCGCPLADAEVTLGGASLRDTAPLRIWLGFSASVADTLSGADSRTNTLLHRGQRAICPRFTWGASYAVRQFWQRTTAIASIAGLSPDARILRHVPPLATSVPAAGASGSFRIAAMRSCLNPRQRLYRGFLAFPHFRPAHFECSKHSGQIVRQYGRGVWCLVSACYVLAFGPEKAV